MCIIGVRHCDFSCRMDSCFKTISSTCEEVIGLQSPYVLTIQVDYTTSIVSPENNFILYYIICRVERIKRSTNTISEPELLGTFITIEHTSTISIRVSPICTCLVFYSVWHPIAIEIFRQKVVSRVILWI